jgi:hypothetical protein
MVHGDTRARLGLSTFLVASSALIWISAVIVMGILAYLVSEGMSGDHVIYGLVIVSYPWPISCLMYGITGRWLTEICCPVCPHDRLLSVGLPPAPVPRIRPSLQLNLLVPLDCRRLVHRFRLDLQQVGPTSHCRGV